MIADLLPATIGCSSQLRPLALLRTALLLAPWLAGPSAGWAQTAVSWNDAGADFATGANWVGGVAPADSLTANIASFGTASPVNQPVLASSQSVAGVEFYSGAGAFTLSGTGILTLGASGVGNAATAGTQTISLPLALGAATSFSNAGALAVSGAVATAGNTLTLTGAGASGTVSGVISGSGGIIKDGSGTWTLSGANTFTGTTTVARGTLTVGDGAIGNLNGTTGTALTFNSLGGVFNVSEAPDSSQGMGLLMFGAGEGVVQSSHPGSGNTTLTFSDVAARTAGATGNFVANGGINGSSNKIALIQYAGASPPTGTLLDKGLFFGGSSYASYDSTGFLRAYANGDIGYVAVPSGETFGSVTSASNVDVTGAISAQTTAAVNTIRIDGGNSISLAAGASLAVDGILKTGPGDATISGGTAITAATSGSELVIRSDTSGVSLMVSTPITDAGGSPSALTKSGPGILTLSAANTHSGTTTLGAGRLLLAHTGALQNSTLNQIGNGYLAFGAGLAAVSLGGLTSTGADPKIGLFNYSSQPVTLSVGFNNASTTYAGRLFGAGSLVKEGTGTLTLSGSNSYEGTTTINGGVISISNMNNLGATPASYEANWLTLNAGSLEITKSLSFSSSRGIVLGANGGTFDTSSGSLYVSGIISGSGSLTKSGSLLLNLTGANTYSGATSIKAGTLAIASDQNLGVAPGSATANKLTLDGGTLNTTADFTLSANRGVTLGASGGTIYTNSGTTLTYGGVAAGTGALTKTGAGTLTLTGTNTYSGGTTISAGELQIGNGGTTGSITGNIANSGTVTFNRSNSFTFSGVISGNGALQKAGGGTLTLSGANTFTGATTIGGGLLAISSDSNLGTAPGAPTPGSIVFNGGTLQTTQSVTLDPNRGITLGTGGTFGPSGGTTLTYGGVVSGSGTLTKNNLGTLALTGANAYTGTTTVAAGALRIGDGATGSLNGTTGTALTFNTTGGTFEANEAPNSTQGMSLLTFQGGEGSVQSTYPGSGNTVLTFGNVAARTAGATGNFVASGGTYGATNKIVLSQFGGAPVPSGALLNKGLFFGGSSYAAYDSGGFLRAYGSGDTGYIAATGGATFGSVTSSSNVDVTGAITAQTTASVNTLRLAGASNLALASGATLGADGILKAGGNAASISGGTVLTAAANGSELVIRTDAASDSLTISTPIANAGSSASALTKSGAGTLTLAAANTYTGNTTLNTGKLVLANGYALQNSTLTQVGGAALEFDGISSASIGGLSSTGGSAAITLANTASQPVALTVGSSSNSSYAGVLSGSGSLTKVGTGTLTLSGTNTYSGATSIKAGTLSINSDSRLGAAPGAATPSHLTLDGGTLQTTSSITLNANRGVVLGAGGGTFSINSGTTLTYGGIIAGSGALTASNSGTLTLSGANSYTGTTTILNGVVRVTGSLNGTSGTALTFGNVGGTFNVNEASGRSQGMGSLTFGAGEGTALSTWTSPGNTVLTFADVVRSSGASGNFATSGGTNGTTNRILLTNFAGAPPSAGSLLDKGVFFNGSSYAAYDSGGFVRAYGNGDIGYVAAPAGATFGSVSSASNVDLAGAITAQTTATVNTLRDPGAYDLTLGAGATLGADGILKSGGTTATFSGGAGLTTRTSGGELVIRTDASTDSLVINTSILANGGNSLTKTGAGTLTLGAAGSFTGTTTVAAGTLSLADSYALQFSTLNLSVGSLTFAGIASATLGGLAGGSPMALANDTSQGVALSVGNNNASTSYSGVLSGTGNLVKIGTGTLTLSGANTYSGTTTIKAGILSINGDNRLGTAPGAATAGHLTLDGGTLQTTPITLNANRGVALGVGGGTFNPTSGTLTYGGIVTGSGSLTKTGAGGLALSGSNTYTGPTTLSAGNLTISSDANLGTAPGAPVPGHLMLNGGTLATTASFTLDANRGIKLGATTTFSTNAGTTLTYAGIIAGSGGLAKSIGTGTLTLAGANTHTGTTSVSAGTLALTNSDALQNSTVSVGVGSLAFSGISSALFGGLSGAGSLALTNDASAPVTLSVGNNNANTTYSGVLSGSGGLTKVGTGTLTLTGANTYTGTTTVSDGVLKVGLGTTGSLNGTIGTALTINGSRATASFYEAAGSAQGMGLLTFAGGDGGVTSTYPGSGTTTLTFSDLAARGAGAIGAFNATDGTSSTNQIVLSNYRGTPTSNGSVYGTLLDRGLFFQDGGASLVSYAAVNSNGVLRAYGAGDANYAVASGGATFGAVTATSNVDVKGAITAQTTTAVNTIRIAGAFDISLASGATLAVDGILKADSTTSAISGGTGLTTASPGAELIIRTAAESTLTLATPILANGASSLTKSGAGTVTLAGANTYTGPTTINFGTVAVGADGNLGAAPAGPTPGLLSFSDGMLQTTASFTLNPNRGIALNPAGAISTDSGTVLTYGGVIAGAGTFTKSGAGTLTLTGANLYTGTTVVAGGGTLNVGNGSTGSLNGAAGTALTFNSGGGKFNVQGATGGSQGMGTLTFSGAEGIVQSTYAGVGNTTLLIADLATRGGASAGNFVTNGGINGTTNKIVIAQFNGSAPTVGTLLDEGFFFNGSSYAAYDSAGFLRAYGSGDSDYVAAPAGAAFGAVTSASNVEVTGAITAQPTVTVNTIRNSGVHNISLDSDATLKVEGILKTGGGAATISGGLGLTTATNGGQMVVRTDTLDDSLNIGTPISPNGASKLTKAGAGTLTLSAANTFTSNTNVLAGTLEIANANAVPNSTVSVYGGTVAFRGVTSALFGGLTGLESTAFALANESAAPVALSVGNNNASSTYPGVLSGGGSLVKVGTGTLTLTGANAFAGGTIVNGGTLLLNTSGALRSTGTIVVNDQTGGASDFELGDNVAQTIGSLTLGGVGATPTTNNTVSIGSGATLTLGGNVTSDATGNPSYFNIYGGTLDLGGATRTFDIANSTTVGSDLSITSVISGSGGIVKTGNGGLKLYGTTPSTYTGATTINAGELFLSNQYGGSNVLPTNTDVVVNATAAGGTATLKLSDGYLQSIRALELGGGTVSSMSQVTLGTGAKLTFGGSLTYSAAGNPMGASIAGGVLELGSASRTFNVGDSATASSDLAVSSEIGGAGSRLVKTGGGRLALSGANTYSGGTTIAAGSLFVENISGSGVGTGPVTVQNGALLAGVGFIGGTTTLEAGGHLVPGGYSSAGTLTFSSGLTLQSSGILDFRLGTASDKVVVSGGTLAGPGSGSLTLNLTDAGGFAAGAYTLFDFSTGGTTTSSFDAADFVFGTTIAGFTYDLALSGSTLQLTAVSAVPEPSAYAAVAGCVVLGAAAWRRRRRQARAE